MFSPSRLRSNCKGENYRDMQVFAKTNKIKANGKKEELCKKIADFLEAKADRPRRNSVDECEKRLKNNILEQVFSDRNLMSGKTKSFYIKMKKSDLCKALERKRRVSPVRRVSPILISSPETSPELIRPRPAVARRRLSPVRPAVQKRRSPSPVQSVSSLPSTRSRSPRASLRASPSPSYFFPESPQTSLYSGPMGIEFYGDLSSQRSIYE
jgi:hypothetical protein